MVECRIILLLQLITLINGQYQYPSPTTWDYTMLVELTNVSSTVVRAFKVCEDDKCFLSQSPIRVKTKVNCKNAYCPSECKTFKTFKNCPICKCQSFTSREVCNLPTECESPGFCFNSLCIYPLNVCTYDNECKYTEHCASEGLCVPNTAGTPNRTISYPECKRTYECAWNKRCVHGLCQVYQQVHLEDIKCIRNAPINQTSGRCPEHYECRDETCVSKRSVQTVSCDKAYTCKAGQDCVDNWCIDTNSHHLLDVACGTTYDCPKKSYECRENTCWFNHTQYYYQN